MFTLNIHSWFFLVNIFIHDLYTNNIICIFQVNIANFFSYDVILFKSFRFNKIMGEKHFTPLIIDHMHFSPYILKKCKLTYELFLMCKTTIMLTFLFIVERNRIHSSKFNVSGYILFFSLGTKVIWLKVQRCIRYLFFVNNGWKFNKRIKVHI